LTGPSPITRPRASVVPKAGTPFAALVVLAALLSLVWPTAALAISRDEVIARAQSVMNDPMPYSQVRFNDGWRNDCSGYVSWVWGTGSNKYVTANMSSISTRISKEELKPGDCLLKAGSHVRLFYAWADDAHTSYVAYEQTPPRTWSSIKNYKADIDDGYVPYRYDRISDSPAPWYLGHDPLFNVWDKGSKSADPSRTGWVPVWWLYGSTNPPSTSWQVRSDQVSSPTFALGLTNAAAVPTTYVETRQRVAASPGRGYTFVASARTTAKPSAVELHLQFFGASGTEPLKHVWTSGDRFGVNAAGFKAMSLTATAPAGTVRVEPVLGLRGATNPAGGPGGNVAFDDVYLYVSSPLPVYRFYNPHTGAHFYTASGHERDTVIGTLQDTFLYEGPAYGVVATAANNSPLYRFYNQKNGTHFYTASKAECENVKSTLASTYSYDGPVYNVSPIPVAGSVPVYRFYNKKNGSHFYTNSEAERDFVIAKLGETYTLEGPAFFLAQ